MQVKYNLVFTFILIFSSGDCGEYLLPNSDKQLLKKENIANKTKTFYRYARNEIFARKNYKFNNPDFVLFFNNQTGYKAIENVEIKLSDIEKSNVEYLKKLEDSTALEPCEILFKYDFNRRPLFYIGENLQKIFKNVKWKWGKFLLLDDSFKWTLQCPSIPPEFLINNAISSIRCDDSGRALTENQVSFDDIDAGYENNSGVELRVVLVGPSDDAEILYFGFDATQQFINLFSIPSGGFQTKKISNSKMLLFTMIRKDLQGTSWYNQEYLFDTISKKIYEVPDLFLPPEFPDRSYKCKTSFPVYYDARSAAKEAALALVGTIEPGLPVYFLNFYRVEGDGSAQIRYNLNGIDYTGWINQKNIGPWSFEGLSAAD